MAREVRERGFAIQRAHAPGSRFVKIVERARPTRRRIPVAIVATIIPAFDGMRAWGSSLAARSPRTGFAARGTAKRPSRAHGVKPANRTPIRRTTYAAAIRLAKAVVARSTPRRTTRVRFPTEESAGMSGTSLIHKIPATRRPRERDRTMAGGSNLRAR